MKHLTDADLRLKVARIKLDMMQCAIDTLAWQGELFDVLRVLRGGAIGEHGAPVQLKRDARGSASRISGYASTFGTIDSAREIVMPGAFTATLAKHRAAGTMPLLLWQHNTDEPIGVWTSLKEDGQGLFADGNLITSVQRGAEAAALIAADALNGLSIGYRVLEDEVDSSGIRRLLKLHLLEISIVSFPANADARLRGGKEYTAPDLSSACDRLSDIARRIREHVT